MAKPLLNYCLVTQNLASIIEDSTYDSDRFPDVSDISGEVIFTPNIANGKAYQLFDSDGEAYTVPVSRIPAKIINGEIVHEDSPGIYLFAAGAGSNPDKITYSVEYRNLRTGDLSFSLSPLKFEAIPGGEVDLTMATPVVGATPAGVVRGPRGAGLESIVVDGSELVFTAADEVHSFEMSRIPLDEMVRAEADAAAEGVRDGLAADVSASQSARDAAEGHANRAKTSETNSKTSETNAKQFETNAGDYAAVATAAATEAVDAMDAAALSAAAFSIYTGTGSPEGNVSAPVGSIYTDSAATNGAIRWIKTSGTGNTGWVVEYGDTGWRLIPNRNETQEGQIYIRRVVDTCFIRVSKYLDPGNYAKHIATIPTGFRPEGLIYGLIVDSGAGSTNSIIGSYSVGTLSWTRDINGGFERPSTEQSGEITYSTTNPWPTTLPGTPA